MDFSVDYSQPNLTQEYAKFLLWNRRGDTKLRGHLTLTEWEVASDSSELCGSNWLKEVELIEADCITSTSRLVALVVPSLQSGTDHIHVPTSPPAQLVTTFTIHPWNPVTVKIVLIFNIHAETYLVGYF